MGSSLDAFDPPVYLEMRLGKPVDRPALREKQHKLLLEILESQPPLPGVEQYLHQAQERGIKVAVASSSGIDWVRGNLDRLGLLPSFHELCTNEDVPVVKPDPGLYYLALSVWGWRRIRLWRLRTRQTVYAPPGLRVYSVWEFQLQSAATWIYLMPIW